MQLLGTGHQRSGKTSRIQVESNTYLTYASWKLSASLKDLETTNFESYNTTAAQTFDEGISGALGCDITSGGDWDQGTNALGSDPPGLFPRDNAGPINYILDRLDAVTPWAFPYIRIRGATNGADVAGKVAFDFSGKSQGPFTYPSGTA